jgi:NAD(P)H-flavin reductase
LLYRDEFEKLAERYQSFHFLPTITRPTESWSGRIGRVQAHLDEALAIQTPEELSNVDVYICGLTEMVDDVRKELKKRGLDRKQIIYEKYD